MLWSLISEIWVKMFSLFISMAMIKHWKKKPHNGTNVVSISSALCCAKNMQCNAWYFWPPLPLCKNVLVRDEANRGRFIKCPLTMELPIECLLCSKQGDSSNCVSQNKEIHRYRISDSTVLLWSLTFYSTLKHNTTKSVSNLVLNKHLWGFHTVTVSVLCFDAHHHWLDYLWIYTLDGEFLNWVILPFKSEMLIYPGVMPSG